MYLCDVEKLVQDLSSNSTEQQVSPSVPLVPVLGHFDRLAGELRNQMYSYTFVAETMVLCRPVVLNKAWCALKHECVPEALCTIARPSTNQR